MLSESTQQEIQAEARVTAIEEMAKAAMESDSRFGLWKNASLWERDQWIKREIAAVKRQRFLNMISDRPNAAEVMIDCYLTAILREAGNAK
jgi:hypothetical protein